MATNYTSTGADTFPAGVVRSFAVARALSNINLSTTYADVGSMTITVTPKTTSSKFWISALMHVYFSPSATNNSWCTLWSKIVVTPAGGSAAIVNDDEDYGSDAYGWGVQRFSNADRMAHYSIESLHSPSSTTAQTYKLMARLRADGNITLNKFNTGHITVTEIG